MQCLDRQRGQSREKRPRMTKRNAIGWAAGAALAAAAGIAAWWSFQYAQDRHHWRAAQLALASQDADLARAHLTHCLAHHGDSLEVRLLAAKAARLAGDYDAAEEHLAICETQVVPASAEVKEERALLQVQEGDISGLDYLKSIADGREPPPALLEALAYGMEATLFFDAAAECLQRLLQQEPDNPRARLLAGSIMLRKRYPSLALQEFEAAVRLLPNALTPRLRLAECLLDLGEPREAAAHLEVLEKQHADAPERLLVQARAAEYRAQPQRAREILNKLLAAQPAHVDALVAMGQLEYRDGEARQALPWLRRAIARHPDQAEAWECLARCYAALGESIEEKRCRAEFDRVTRALGEIRRLTVRVMQEKIDDIGLRIELAERYERLHEPGKAIQWRMCTLHLNPRHAATHGALADLFAETGQPHRAARHRALAGS
jgi:tetratricopeptide (TPR) repeat protein